MKNYISFFILLYTTIFCFSQDQGGILSAIIIGSGEPEYNPERSGPSVLIQYKDTKILVDMGNGAQANLNKAGIKIKELDGLLCTHHHMDHNEELTPIFIRSILGGNNFMLAGPAPTSDFASSIMKLYAEDMNYRMRNSGRTVKDVKNKYTTKNLTGGETFTIGDINIRCARVNHTMYTVSYRFDAGGQSIVVSGDLTYSESLSKLAENADYLIIDSGGTKKKNASIRNGTKRNGNQAYKNRQRAHVNLEESSKMAKEANAKHMVLTHFTIGEVDEPATIAEISKNYIGKVHFGYDLMTIPVTNSINPLDESVGSL